MDKSRKGFRIISIGGFVALLLWPLYISLASAHGFGGAEYTPPVPLWLYLYGAAAAVVLSFIILGAFVGAIPESFSYPRYNIFNHSLLRMVLGNQWFVEALRFLTVGFVVLTVLAGFWGTDYTIENIAPVLVWVIWWVGMGIVCALVGNLWMLINPWRTVFGWAEAINAMFGGRGGLSLKFRYPKRWGIWPAVIQFFIFIWVELAYDYSDSTVGIAIMVLSYSLLTLLGMVLFGKHVWLRNGEVFSIYFNVLARFAPTEVRVSDPQICKECEDGLTCHLETDGCVNCNECVERSEGRFQFNIRPWAVGLARGESISPSTLIFVLFMLSSVTFDGFQKTAVWHGPVRDIQQQFTFLGEVHSFTAAETVGILGTLLIFLALYLGLSFIVFLIARGGVSYKRVIYGFLYSLVPIALVYNVAHYWTFLVTTGQWVIPALSDPFGFGWNLLGTAGYIPNFRPFSVGLIWGTQVVLIIVGHVVAVFLAHVEGGRLVKSQRRALLSQLPMLVLMVIYTMSSLWILSRDFAVEAGPGS